jgi:hypothetical protein
VERTVRALGAAQRLAVDGRDPELALHLSVWARQEGHGVENGVPPVVVRGTKSELRWSDAERAGTAHDVSDWAPATWGLAARGALVEGGGPRLSGMDLDRRDLVWTDIAPKLYAQAAANQWDPATAIKWRSPQLPPEAEQAVVEIMTYLIENEQAALTVSARFLGRVHPHFREIAGFLATQAADEARHAESLRPSGGTVRLPSGSVRDRRTSLIADLARRARLG